MNKIKNRRLGALFSVIVGVMVLATTLAATTALAKNVEQVLNISIEFECPEIWLMSDGTVSISMKDTNSYGEAGLPVLPTKSVNILIPQGKEVKSIQVIGDEVAIEGSYFVEWGQQPVPIGTEQISWTSPNEGIYTSNELYPGRSFERLLTQSFKGYKILAMNLYPVQYIPNEGKLFYYENMEISLTMIPSTSSDETLFRGLSKDAEAVAGTVANPGTTGTYSKATDGSSNGPTSLVDPLDSYQYVIITTNALKPDFQDLLEWKNTKLSSTIVAVEDIYADPAYNGVDDAEEIRNFIKDAYLNWETDFVLLGGDDVDDYGNQIVPIRGIYLSAGGYSYTNVPCDFYFGALDGTWNDDGDDRWGEADEIDYYSEVSIGRITADTPTEIENWIYKVLDYEKNPNSPHLDQCSWLGEKLDASTWGGDSKDEIIPLFPPDEYEFTKLYDREGTFGRTAVINELNKGPHLTNHLGHANSGYTMGIYSSDVDGLTNTEYFFSYSQGCMAGAFDQGYSGNNEAISEHFVYTKHGAFAVIMNARYGWYSPGTTHGPSQYFDYEFFDALYSEGIKNLGAANDDSKHDNAPAAQTCAYRRWCFLELNLHGDPHTPISEPIRYDHDLIVTNLQAPDWMEPATIYVEATIGNKGRYDETDITVEFLVDSVVLDTRYFSIIESGAYEGVSFEWTPTEHPRQYIVGVYVVPIPDENVTTNNLREKPVNVDYRPVADAGPDVISYTHRELTFDGSNSYDPDDEIVEFRWDLGDGTIEYGMIVTHTYHDYGNNIVTLKVTDGFGGVGTDTCRVDVWECGHDMELVSFRTPKSTRLGTIKPITVKVKNVGTYVDQPMQGGAMYRQDYVLITLESIKPDGSKVIQTKSIQLYKDASTSQKFYVTFDQRGDWYHNVYIDICDSNGNINPFPKRDEHPENNEMNAGPTSAK